MKAAGWAILILSVLLALSIAALVYLKVTSDKNLTNAVQKVKDANALVVGALTTQKDQLQKEKDALAASDAAKGALISTQGTQIASLKDQIKKAKDVGGVAVAAGADLKTTFDAGATIVAQINIPALTTWYSLAGTKIDPVLGNIADMNARYAVLSSTADAMAATNLQLTILHNQDTVTIGSLGDTIRLDGLTISEIKGDLASAQGDLTKVVNSIGLIRTVAWVGGSIAVAETLYIVGHAMGWFK